MVMIDTKNKKGKNLLDYMNMQELKRFVEVSHEKGLKVALAGSLDKTSISKLSEIKPDIIGVRGAVCRGNDRTKGISIERIRELKSLSSEHFFV